MRLAIQIIKFLIMRRQYASRGRENKSTYRCPTSAVFKPHFECWNLQRFIRKLCCSLQNIYIYIYYIELLCFKHGLCGCVTTIPSFSSLKQLTRCPRCRTSCWDNEKQLLSVLSDHQLGGEGANPCVRCVLDPTTQTTIGARLPGCPKLDRAVIS